MFAHTTILGSILGFGLLTAPATAVAVPSADTSPALRERGWVGNIDVPQACSLQYAGSVCTAATTGSGCNDWTCACNLGRGGLNMDAYCVALYGGNAFATCSGGVYNWQCQTY